MGTPQKLTDHEGRVAWSASYKAWGQARQVISEAGRKAGFRNPIRFQGQYLDEETGLHYNRYRYYDPGVGRFVSKDPIKLLGGLNLQLYAPNPAEWIDPLGLAKGKAGNSSPAGGALGGLKCRATILAESGRIIKSYEGRVRAIDPNARLGIRGSVATGVRSSGGPFNPDLYDVDAYIISDKLKDEGIVWGNQHPELRKIQSAIRRDMDASPCLKGRTKDGGKFGFKIFGSKAENGFEKEGGSFFIKMSDDL